MSENTMVKLCGLWASKAKDESTFYSGKLGYSARILVFKNRFKQGEKDPDLILYIAPAEKQEKPKPAGDDEAPF